MLLPAGLFVLASVAAASGMVAAGSLSVYLAHVFFALAALPLMLAAILHFVPVLTRSAAPSPLISAMPWLAAAGGLAAVAALAGLLPRYALLAAAPLAGGAACTVLLWIVARLRRALGAPHPGASWYPVALAMLLLGLLCVFGIVLDVDRYPFWRALHLHANLFGWIVLTALGTLPVLLPTALMKPEAGAAGRLKRDLPLAAGGAFALALGAALAWPVLALAGALALTAVAVRDLAAWANVFGWRQLRHGAPLALGLATCFLVVMLIAGAAHGFRLLPADRLLPAFVFGFLLLLVSGALTQLLPVWRYAGPQTPARRAMHRRLTALGGWRALLFFVAGLLVLAGAQAVASALALSGLLLFVGGLVHALR